MKLVRSTWAVDWCTHVTLKVQYKLYYTSLLLDISQLIYRGYSNVFVKYVFYFSSEVDNIYISRVANEYVTINTTHMRIMRTVHTRMRIELS